VLDLDPRVLTHRSAAVCAWARLRRQVPGPPGSRHRSLALRPSGWHAEGELPRPFDALVAQVVQRRDRALADAIAVPPVGRWLLYEPEQQLACGTLEFVTHGLFNGHNVPAWDLWAAATILDAEPVLISYVPEWLVPAVDEGVQSSAEECVRWLA